MLNVLSGGKLLVILEGGKKFSWVLKSESTETVVDEERSNRITFTKKAYHTSSVPRAFCCPKGSSTP
ncbi:unnamed protein product [Ilex paraguariensis]